MPGTFFSPNTSPEDLEEYQRWRPLLHDLGSCEVKRGVRVSVANFYDDQFGNAKLSQRFETMHSDLGAAGRRP